MAINLFRPYVSWRAIFGVVKVLLGTQLTEGKVVRQFEEEFGKKFGKKHVVALNSGTSALELAYELAGIKEGDEVITPVLTCTATNIPLIRKGAKIVFADISSDLNINIEDVERKITPKTKAIVFVHFGGNNRGLREILKIGKRHHIKIIEDAAQAVGSETWGISDYCAVSLQAIKSLTSGDGGFLLCRSKEDFDKAKRLRWFGYDREQKQKKGDTDLTEAGYKYHMNNITAAIGLGNLRSIDPVIVHRKRLAKVYSRYGLFAHMWLAGGFIDDYKGLKDFYALEDIEIGQHHYRNDKYTLFKKFKTHCPMMDVVDGHYFFVPNHYGVSELRARQIGKMYEIYQSGRTK